ncbi:hypothetical protein PHSY_000379 [Pseudozyma hubeiensis SY62]|uniref:Uncharacterized protein n=1 Tax=Pseudozyma hubeiensis (strain SY62) TaxID=1305764 RepID=R9NW96_PSEHS|nr:hypothetical protein PHSY_000379 [Pseudozyma hubeiensis SY62]GAC92823.1 hypothetical protein PHSY_000379 [Pseudozyma hubeiensis SY62]
MTTKIKPRKNCTLCNKIVDPTNFGNDFTCRTCRHECHRCEPLYRELVALHQKSQREQAAALKVLKDEIVELKTTLSTRQQKASTTLKGLKDTMSTLSCEINYLKQVKTKVEGDDRLSKIEKDLEEVKSDVKSLDQEVAGVYAERREDAISDKTAVNESMQETLNGLEDFTRRLKDAFVALTGPEEKKVKKEKEQREQEARRLKEGMLEMQDFMRQMQQAFSMLPVIQPQQQAPTSEQAKVKTEQNGSSKANTGGRSVVTNGIKKS